MKLECKLFLFENPLHIHRLLGRVAQVNEEGLGHSLKEDRLSGVCMDVFTCWVSHSMAMLDVAF